MSDADEELPSWLLDADKALQCWTSVDDQNATQISANVTTAQVTSGQAAAVQASLAVATQVPSPMPSAPLDADVLSAIDGLAASSMSSFLVPPAGFLAQPAAASASPLSLSSLASSAALPAERPAAVPAAAAAPVRTSPDILEAFDPLARAAQPPPAAAAPPLVAAPTAATETPVPASPWSPVRRSAAPKAAPPPPPQLPHWGESMHHQLASMFPTVPAEVVAAALRATGSTEAAVDKLLQMTAAKPGPPRAAAGRTARASAPISASFRLPLELARSDQVTFKRGFFRSGPRVA